jgi:hypothetical protein
MYHPTLVVGGVWRVWEEDEAWCARTLTQPKQGERARKREGVVSLPSRQCDCFIPAQARGFALVVCCFPYRLRASCLDPSFLIRGRLLPVSGSVCRKAHGDMGSVPLL